MRVALYGASGKVGVLLEPALRQAGHDVVDARALGPEGCDAAIDFTLPDVVVGERHVVSRGRSAGGHRDDGLRPRRRSIRQRERPASRASTRRTSLREPC